MTKEQVALKLALEALEGQCRLVSQTRHRLVGPAITAIKEVLNSCQCPECKVVLHASDCAVHNEPAYPKGQCNCGAQPEQEPVGQLLENASGRGQVMWFNKPKDESMLYTTPPPVAEPHKRKPLSDEEFRAILRSLSRQQGWDGDGWDLALKEAIEAAHGIIAPTELKGEA